MSKLIVAVLGGVVQDFTTVCDRIPDDGETALARNFSMQPGGKGSNSAVAIHRLSRSNPKRPPSAESKILDIDMQVRMVGAVGKDQFGPALRENLEDCGVNVEGVRIVEDEATAIANIIIEADSGANRIMQYPGAAWSLVPDDFAVSEHLGGGIAPDLVVALLELGRDAVEQAIETAARLNIDVLLRPSPARTLMPNIYKRISHLVMNETEAMTLLSCQVDDIGSLAAWTESATYLHELGVRNVVVTLGDQGAFYSTDSGKCGIIKAETNCIVLDTSGAGDSFVGGYVAKLMGQKQRNEEFNIEEAVAFGCKAGARIVEYWGCLAPIVWADEVNIPRRSRSVEHR